MKQGLWRLGIIVLLVGSLAGCAHMGPNTAQEGMAVKTGPSPTIVLDNPMVKIAKTAKVAIIGAGFEPGQEIRVLFTPLDDVMTDLVDDLAPYPVPNNIGAWVATWTCGPHLEDNIREGAYEIKVTTMDYKVLARTPIAFYQEKAEKVEKK
jgi:hypothetical protein